MCAEQSIVHCSAHVVLSAPRPPYRFALRAHHSLPLFHFLRLAGMLIINIVTFQPALVNQVINNKRWAEIEVRRK
jgi:hypothetical protein